MWQRFLCITLLVLAFTCPGLATEAAEQEYLVETASPLKAQGVQGSIARSAAPAASATSPSGAGILVYMGFDRNYSGKLYLRVFRADRKEIARSLPVAVTASKDTGTTFLFSFPEGADIRSATSVLLMDEKGVTVPKKETSVMDDAKSILNEIF